MSSTKLLKRLQSKAMTLGIPSRLAASCRQTPQRAAWLEHLPNVLRNLELRWSLRIDAPFDDSDLSCSYVAAVVRAAGTPAVLKIGMPHMEGEHEIRGLRFWNGDPTVRLLMADDALGAMLLERCRPGTALRALAECEQDVVISGLLRRLWRAPSAQHSFRPLSALAEYWIDETLAHIKQWSDTGLGPRRFAPLCGVVPHRTHRPHVGYRLTCMQRPPGGTPALARHRPKALHRRPCLRRDAAPVQLFCEIAIDPARNDPELCGPAWRRSRTRTNVDFRSRSGGAAGRLE